MDRFGDDLTEEVLQYLTFTDKVRLECVSKQWKRCVFQKEFDIELCKSVRKRPLASKFLIGLYDKKRQLDYKSLKSLLEKFPNIIEVRLGSKVKISGAREELSLIGQYCHHIRSMTFISHGIKDLKFGKKYGHKLEELRVTGDNIYIKAFLRVLFRSEKDYS